MIEAVVIGASFGGLQATRSILTSLPAGFSVPVIIVLHVGPHSISLFIETLNEHTPFRVTEAADHEPLLTRTIYFAPPNYHLLVENREMLMLSTEEKVNFSRPSIDVLFETAAWAFGSRVAGVLLTGANNDGAYGLKCIGDAGGITIVEDPETAQVPVMPEAAVKLFTPGYILPLAGIGPLLGKLAAGG